MKRSHVILFLSFAAIVCGTLSACVETPVKGEREALAAGDVA
jgi:hypothetical protein